MSDRDVDINLTELSDDQVLAKHKAAQERKELKAKIISVLSRGHTVDRLYVELPEDKYGEWVPNDKQEIFRMESMGFVIDREYAHKRALHGDSQAGDGSSTVGDAVFMVAPRIMKELIDEARLELYEQANSPRKGRQKEERDFEAETQQQNLPSQIKSRADSANIDDIKAALTATQ